MIKEFFICCFAFLVFIGVCALTAISCVYIIAALDPIPNYEEQIATSSIQIAPSPCFEVIDVSSGIVRTVFAYNSVPGQTDDAPCIAADGSNICSRLAAGECIIAGNWAPLGSEHYIDGIGLCTLADRMNSRYTNEVDLFLGYDIAAAKKFGRQQIIVKSLN